MRGVEDSAYVSAACMCLFSAMLSAISAYSSGYTVIAEDVLPVLITQSPSSLIRTQELASSNSKSCSSSMRLANSGSCFKLRFLLRTSHSGSGRAVEAPETVYTGTVDWLVSFIVAPLGQQRARRKELEIFLNNDAFRKLSVGPTPN